ncbi:MAG: hypothetical protein B9S32_15105 [Verrucomicrobia bacterium Tous-C9LFEB]|nr:MAG: hypothetical protein B9S32_15105 [Verrucomicrobia bacterium Tous-C9LFEB]
MSRGAKMVILDVREELERGEKPLSRILEVAQTIVAGQSLKLITPFEPLPLVMVLRRFGLKHRSRQVGIDHWETLFAEKLPAEEALPQAEVSAPEKVAASSAPTLHTVDARGLEPPQPMVKILTEVEKLKAGDQLEAHTDRRPLHLIDALKERGFQSSSEEQPDGSWITLITCS